MAEETVPKPEEVVAAATETTPESEPEPAAEAAEEAAEEEAAVEEAAAAEEAAVAVTQSESFKEESNVVGDSKDPEKKALDEFKALIQAALANKEFTPPPVTAVKEEVKGEAKEEEKPAEEAASTSEEEVKVKVKVEDEEKPAEESASTSEEEVKVKVKVEEEEKPAEVSSEAPKSEQVAKEEEKAVVVEEESVVVEEEASSSTRPEVTVEEQPPDEEEIFIWGVPLVGDEKSDTVLLKFLRARDFKVKEAMSMLKNTVIWRKQFGIDSLVEEDLGIPELEKVFFYSGFGKEGHPVCYNVFGEFQDKEVSDKAFGDEEKRDKFLKWRIQFLEKGIRDKLDFSPAGVCSMVQVNDFKNSPGPGKKGFRVAFNKAVGLMLDNYPEFLSKQIFINVPWWYLAYNRVISSFLTQRTKSKFVYAGTSKSAETLFKYIAPEQVPVQYGGLSKESDPDFTVADVVTEVIVKPTSKHIIEIAATEGSNLVWELRVLGWEVSYGAEFVPTAEEGYTVIVQKARKFAPADEPYVKNSFKIGEAGKVLLTIDNATSKKKKLLYRHKEKSSTESF